MVKTPNQMSILNSNYHSNKITQWEMKSTWMYSVAILKRHHHFPIFYNQKEAITSKPNIVKPKFKTKMHYSKNNKVLLSPYFSRMNLSIHSPIK